MFLISFKDNRFLGCTKRCGYTHSVPRTGKLTLLDKTCETCGWKLFRLKEEEEGSEGKEEDFCLNRRCPEGMKYWKKAGPRSEARTQRKVSAESAAGSGTKSTARNTERTGAGRVSKVSSGAGGRKESK
jgi:DNA topoisomerase-1